MSNRPPSLVIRWNQLALDAICYTSTPPPIAARVLAMVHTAMYDAWTAYRDCELSTTTADLLRRPTDERTKQNRWKTFSYAAYRVLTELFWLDLPSEHKTIFRDLMCELGYDPDMTTLNHTRPEGIGNLSARLVLEARAGDGANQFATLYDGHYTDYTGYEPINTPDEVCELDRWQPLLVDNKPQQFLVAQWGLVKPFALRIGSRFRPDAPPAAETPEFHEQVKEVIDESANLNDYRKVIAEYWSDGAGTVTPPGHCCQMAHFVARRDDHGSIQDIKLFFVLSNTLFDASIAAWDCKRHHDYVRPITAVRHLYKGKKITAWGGPGEGRTQLFGECWLPYLPTPPFPECVSGHSTFTTAAAEILCRFTGSDEMGDSFTFPKGSSAIEPDITPQKAVTLSWETFSDAACQAGLSRRYGGIHFKGSDEAGQALGRQVAAKVWERACHFFNA